jgi:hypothetical protein
MKDLKLFVCISNIEVLTLFISFGEASRRAFLSAGKNPNNLKW